MQFRTRRTPTDFGASIRTELGTFPAEIVDVTEKGARLRMSKGVYAAETNLQVMIQGQPHPATVIWQQNGTIGVEFRNRLPQATMAAVMRRMARAAPERKRRFLIS